MLWSVSELYPVCPDLQLAVNEFSRTVGLLRGGIERLCVCRQLCGAQQHDTHFSPRIPSLSGLCGARPCRKRGRGAVPEVLLPAGLTGSFWPDHKTSAEISRGGYSLVLNGVAVGFSALAQRLAAVSEVQSRSGLW